MTYTLSNDADRLANVAEQLLKLAREHGASQAQVSLSHSTGLSVHTRHVRVLSRIQETHSGFSLTVFNGNRHGSVDSTDLSFGALEQSVKAACAIAKYTGEDPAAAPATAGQLCQKPRELGLSHPWDLDMDKAIDLAKRMEDGVACVDGQVQSNGAWVNSEHSYYLLASSEGFNHGVSRSFHNLNVSALARNARFNELDSFFSSGTDPRNLLSAEEIGRAAGNRALAYLDQRPLTSRRCPVLFDSRCAASLIGHLTEAISGRALYSNASFMSGKRGQAILPEHLSLYEDPFIPGANASISFDSDGIEPRQRFLVEDGVLQGYLLSLYASRRLTMEPTGNGSGPGNLLLRSNLTRPDDDLPEMLRKLDRGLLVTSLVGNGVRLLSGDYSRGARGLWVENGKIQHAVTGITLSGNLNQMLQNIVAVGNDITSQGAFNTGSVLINSMQISGL